MNINVDKSKVMIFGKARDFTDLGTKEKGIVYV